MARRDRIDTSGQARPLAQSPFGGLDRGAFPDAIPGAGASSTPAAPGPTPRGTRGNRGRVDVIRQTAGRGGKTVTVLSGFKGIAGAELEAIAREIRKAGGVGGTVKGAVIEIQGDQRERAFAVLEAAGFRPVRAGG